MIPYELWPTPPNSLEFCTSLINPDVHFRKIIPCWWHHLTGSNKYRQWRTLALGGEMPFLVRQSASLSTTFIECLMREGAMRQRGDAGSGLEGQPGQWQSQSKETRLGKAIEAAPQQERPGGCTTHLCGAPPACSAIYAKGLFITELLGPSRNAAKDVSYLLRASVSPAAKGAQTRGPRREPSEASACAARFTAHARRGQKAPEVPRRSRGKGRASSAGCGGTSPLSRPVIQRSVWNEGRALKLLF